MSTFWNSLFSRDLAPQNTQKYVFINYNNFTKKENVLALTKFINCDAFLPIFVEIKKKLKSCD